MVWRLYDSIYYFEQVQVVGVCKCVCVLGKWEESEQVNSTQTFYQLQGMKPDTHYRLEIRHNNLTYWTHELRTKGPGTSPPFLISNSLVLSCPTREQT